MKKSMGKLMKKKIINTLAVLLIFSVFGCATFKKKDGLSAKELYENGIEKFNSKNYREAVIEFEKLLADFPDSRIRVPALIALAISQYNQHDYEEAKFRFERFIEQYPASPRVAKAYYFKAMCSFKQMESYERDQTNTRLAQEDFEELIKTFPKGKYVQEAKKNILITHRRLAKHLLYIGQYYFRIGAYQSVINRMNELLEKYPKQKFLDEAVFLLGESYYKEGNNKKAYLVFKTLVKKFPHSKHKSGAIKRLAPRKK